MQTILLHQESLKHGHFVQLSVANCYRFCWEWETIYKYILASACLRLAIVRYILCDFFSQSDFSAGFPPHYVRSKGVIGLACFSSQKWRNIQSIKSNYVMAPFNISVIPVCSLPQNDMLSCILWSPLTKTYFYREQYQPTMPEILLVYLFPPNTMWISYTRVFLHNNGNNSAVDVVMNVNCYISFVTPLNEHVNREYNYA